MNKTTQLEITVLIVNYNSSEFVEVSLYALGKLTKRNHQIFILDNGSEKNDYEKLKKICASYSNVVLERNNTDLRGSQAHAEALNYLVMKINTPYFLILDADATILIKDWDEMLIKQIDSYSPVIGTQAPPSKPQDFPAVYAIFFKSEIFKTLGIDFLPKDLAIKQDTGWMIREAYMRAGLKGKLIEYRNTRIFKSGPFAKLIVAEYYLLGEKRIFASHFSRGSSLGKTKYLNSRKGFLYRLPKIGLKFLEKRSASEKEQWIDICRKLIDDQQMIDEEKYETLNECPYCHCSNFLELFFAQNRLNDQKGKFFITKCQDCGLVFQSPRVKEKYIRDFYSGLGYYSAKDSGQIKKITGLYFRIWRKLTSIFHGRKKWISLIPTFRRGGKVLEIGCAHGLFLEDLKNRGWETTGLEMDCQAAEFAKNKRKLNVICSRVEDMDFPSGKFDAIIMSMVLEHLYEPFASLERIAAWLKDGGEFLFSIPYFNGLEYKIFKQYCYGLHLPHHITFFNKKIIKDFLKKLGFKKIRFYFQYFDRDVVASAQYKYQDTQKNIYKIIAQNRALRILLIRPLVYILSRFGFTGRVSVYAKK